MLYHNDIVIPVVLNILNVIEINTFKYIKSYKLTHDSHKQEEIGLLHELSSI